MAQRRPFSEQKGQHSANGHDDGHDYGHSHSLFGGHSHDEGHNHDAERIMSALEGKMDKGSKITILGLFSNIGLTGVKGFAGWYLHSASLLADAGHSLSDLLGDFVTLFCWRLSRRPPSERYPYGFAKFETLGTTTVSLLLIGGALGIGFHSYHLLLHALTETASTLPDGPLQDILVNVTTSAPGVPQVLASHSHVHSVDPNAAWFAALSVVIKEWMYRATKRVADEENSPVLLANAIHHRSDAYSSIVALFAILGSWTFPALPLDPIGGLLVSFVILNQGIGLLTGAWGDLTDAGVSRNTIQSFRRTLVPLLTSPDSCPGLTGVSDIRARRAGSLVYVDLVATVSENTTVKDTSKIEEAISLSLKGERREIAEIRIRFQGVSSS